MPKCRFSSPTRSEEVSVFTLGYQRSHLGTGMLCEDSIAACATYAKRGECVTNAEQMYIHCKKSCKKHCPSCDVKCDEPGLNPPGDCAAPLGLSYTGKDSTIPRLPDSAFSVGRGVGSYQTGGWTASPHNARLYQPDDVSTKGIGAWCASRSDVNNKKELSLIVDLGRKMRITHVATQGRPSYYEKISEFQIEFSDDKTSGYKQYKENGEVKVFDGSHDNFTPAVNKFVFPIEARFIKFVPTKWNYPCVRLEYYGCDK